MYGIIKSLARFYVAAWFSSESKHTMGGVFVFSDFEFITCWWTGGQNERFYQMF